MVDCVLLHHHIYHSADMYRVACLRDRTSPLATGGLDKLKLLPHLLKSVLAILSMLINIRKCCHLPESQQASVAKISLLDHRWIAVLHCIQFSQRLWLLVCLKLINALMATCVPFSEIILYLNGNFSVYLRLSSICHDILSLIVLGKLLFITYKVFFCMCYIYASVKAPRWTLTAVTAHFWIEMLIESVIVLGRRLETGAISALVCKIYSAATVNLLEVKWQHSSTCINKLVCLNWSLIKQRSDGKIVVLL